MTQYRKAESQAMILSSSDAPRESEPARDEDRFACQYCWSRWFRAFDIQRAKSYVSKPSGASPPSRPESFFWLISLIFSESHSRRGSGKLVGAALRSGRRARPGWFGNTHCIVNFADFLVCHHQPVA